MNQWITCGFLFFAPIFVLAESDGELALVSVLFRHGARNPLQHEMYPNDPHLNHDFSPNGLGSLTNLGKLETYNLGKFLRDQYNDFLGPYYTNEILHARSTDTLRTKMSLQLVLAGLFPPVGAQIWNKDLNWQPIPIHYKPKAADFILRGVLCAQFSEEFDKVERSDEVQKILSKYYKHFMHQLSTLSGKEIKRSCQMSHMYQIFSVESSMNLTLPAWSQSMYPNGKLLNGTLFYYQVLNFNEKLRRLSGGGMIKTLLKQMIAVKEGTQEKARKLFLYSAHEVNIVALFKALEIPVTDVPPYSRAVSIELRKKNNNYFVQFLYNKDNPRKFQKLDIPGCSSLCPLESFIELTKKVLPSDQETMCSRL